MVNAFQAAKDVVIEVDKAWNNLGLMLDKTGARINSLRAKAGTLGPASRAELDAIERSLAGMRAQVQRDPLGVSAGFEARIEPVLKRLETAFEARERHQRRVGDGLAAAHRHFKEPA